MHALWSQPAWTTGSYCHNFADSPHKCKLRAPQSHPLHVQSVIRIYRRLRIRAQIFAHIVIENSQLNAERKTKKKRQPSSIHIHSDKSKVDAFEIVHIGIKTL